MLGLAHLGFAPPSPRASAAACGGNASVADGGQLSVLVAETDEGDAPPPENMHKWRMVIAYDGTKFKGWQYQPSPPTIQCFLENALIRVTKLDRKKLCLVGAGRTDTGVHAWGQV
uniref:tRNA pseudouridine synthase n=1 Tax=Arundo donax TaxID=35708 RepID=A0A0A9DT50_ARUDO